MFMCHFSINQMFLKLVLLTSNSCCRSVSKSLANVVDTTSFAIVVDFVENRAMDMRQHLNFKILRLSLMLVLLKVEL